MKLNWTLTADAADVTAAVAASLVSLALTDRSALEADTLTIALADPQGAIALPRRGARLRLALGWAGAGLYDKGSFLVDEVAHAGPPDVITLEARAPAFGGALKDQREGDWHWKTLGDILATIAARNGLTAAIDAGLAGQTVPHLDQTTESDAHILSRLGRDYGAIATIKDGRLVFVPLGSGRSASGAALPAAPIDRRDCSRHSFRIADRDGTVDTVRARWRDLDAGVTRHAVAGSGGGSVKTLKRDYPTEAEALAAARAALARQRRAAREMTLTCLGRPEIAAGQPLALTGFRPEIDDTAWIADEVSHRIDANGGFTTAIKASAGVHRG